MRGFERGCARESRGTRWGASGADAAPTPHPPIPSGVLFGDADAGAQPRATTSAPAPPRRAPGVRLGPTTRGYRLLQRAGWSDGEALGAGGGGLTEPLAPVAAVGRAGLGARGKDAARRARPPRRPAPPDSDSDEPEPVAMSARAAAEADAARAKAVGRALAREFCEGGATTPGAALNPLLAPRRRGRGANPLL